MVPPPKPYFPIIHWYLQCFSLIFSLVFSKLFGFSNPLTRWQLLYMLLFAVAAAMCALQFAIYCHDQAARLVKPFAAPCQLLNCLRMIGTQAPLLPHLSSANFPLWASPFSGALLWRLWQWNAATLTAWRWTLAPLSQRSILADKNRSGHWPQSFTSTLI